jgi:hypothetical protein
VKTSRRGRQGIHTTAIAKRTEENYLIIKVQESLSKVKFCMKSALSFSLLRFAIFQSRVANVSGFVDSTTLCEIDVLEMENKLLYLSFFISLLAAIPFKCNLTPANLIEATVKMKCKTMKMHETTRIVNKTFHCV